MPKKRTKEEQARRDEMKPKVVAYLDRQFPGMSTEPLLVGRWISFFLKKGIDPKERNA